MVLVVGMYFSRMTTLTIRGEESRRGFVAREMLETNQWIVPTFQGTPFFMSSRPPLHNWAIACVGYLRGGVDVLSVRLPSATALLILVLILYGYSRTFLSRPGALAAAASYATFGQVLQLGRLGESDLLFTLFVASSLFLWHAGYSRRWPASATWMAGYLFAALATLTKGPQGPVYFATPIAAYLLWTSNWRYAVSRAHGAGLAVFVAVWGSWQLPFFLRTGLAGVRHIYLGDVSMYGNTRTVAAIATHLVAYPASILLGCLMPWSILLILYFRKDFRERLGAARDNVLFLVLCIATTFPTVWLVTGARTRFFMPLYPCFAALIGLAIQHCLEAEAKSFLRKFWNGYLTAIAAAMFAIAAGLLLAPQIATAVPSLVPLSRNAVVFASASVALAATAMWTRRARSRREAAGGILAVAAFMGLAFVGPLTNFLKSESLDTINQIAKLKEKLPEAAHLRSLGIIDHGFAFALGEPIALGEWPKPGAPLDPAVRYFCFNYHDVRDSPPFFFPWEPVAVLSFSRNQGENELDHLVVVGRSLPKGVACEFSDVVRQYKLADHTLRHHVHAN
jgi:4-amino-4-deoxy-L-arabinose transferase-like glycosyltransferase